LRPSSENDFQQGMAALRTPGDAINQNDAVTEEIDWFAPKGSLYAGSSTQRGELSS
jgi:hypothetical protein